MEIIVANPVATRDNFLCNCYLLSESSVPLMKTRKALKIQEKTHNHLAMGFLGGGADEGNRTPFRRGLESLIFQAFSFSVAVFVASSGFTTDELAMRLGVNKSSLWRYRHQPYAFSKAPFGVITKAMRLAQVNNDILRTICGL